MTRTVLVTGASSGIGAETARAFAAAGWQVAATMRDPAASVDLPAGVARPRLDVTDDATVRAAVIETLARFGAIDVLVNNAGYGLVGPLEAMADEDLAKQYDTNVIGLARVMRAVIPHMRERRAGTIVNVSSIGGRMTFPFMSPYHGTKFAVEGISESVRYELAPFGIRVKLVEPGGIATEFAGRSMRMVTTDVYRPMADAMMRQFESRKLPGPHGVAAMILRAAIDPSPRLRYLVHHQPFWSMRHLVPDRVWQRMMASAIKPRAAR